MNTSPELKLSAQRLATIKAGLGQEPFRNMDEVGEAIRDLFCHINALDAENEKLRKALKVSEAALRDAEELMPRKDVITDMYWNLGMETVSNAVSVVQSALRIPDTPSYFKNDGDKSKMLDAIDRHAKISKEQFDKFQMSDSNNSAQTKDYNDRGGPEGTGYS